MNKIGHIDFSRIVELEAETANCDFVGFVRS